MTGTLVFVSIRRGLMLESLLPRESWFLGRSARTSQNERLLLASYWMMSHWYGGYAIVMMAYFIVSLSFCQLYCSVQD